VEREKSPVYVLLLDLSAVTDIDFSAVTELKKTMKWLRANNLTLFATAVNGVVRDMLKKSGFIKLLGEENVFWLHNDAVYAAKEVIRTKTTENQDEDDDFVVPLRGSSYFGGDQRAFAYRERPIEEQSFWNKII
jgi:MFS superfamily sulfate permease-like transporter